MRTYSSVRSFRTVVAAVITKSIMSGAAASSLAACEPSSSPSVAMRSQSEPAERLQGLVGRGKVPNYVKALVDTTRDVSRDQEAQPTGHRSDGRSPSAGRRKLDFETKHR